MITSAVKLENVIRDMKEICVNPAKKSTVEPKTMYVSPAPRSTLML